ncbi:MAG: arylsulfatase [Opitutales bacterium]|nr:arylsulfatase [Opitutales bacterium]
MKPAFIFLTLSVALCFQGFSADTPPPNIIVMMADDMGVGDTSAYQDWTKNADADQVKTPSMDRLARMGIRFTDAHASSRCTATRYGLLTGRYSWRTRLKYAVLKGPQGDPLIELDRPTIATLLKSRGYRTGMTGKWHVGLTFRDAKGNPAASYDVTDLRRGIADGPLDHGFDFFHGTSRSHPSSAPQGWLMNRKVPAATGPKEVDQTKYILHETGPVNFRMAKRFLNRHLREDGEKPFFLYYACHSNHLSHDPCEEIEGVPVKGQSHPGGKRSDFIYENDVVLGQLLKILERDDPRNPGHALLENTLVIFTSDNGAENAAKTATGPVRSNKGSVYEGGHRVPFIAAWKAGGIGDGDDASPGQSSDFPIAHVDLFATFAEITGAPKNGGGEDSFGILEALRGNPPAKRPPLTHNDHKDWGGKSNHQNAAWLAVRMDDPVVDGDVYEGQWKLFIDQGLLLEGRGKPVELYNLKEDLAESDNRIGSAELKPLVTYLEAELRRYHDREENEPAEIVVK